MTAKERVIIIRDQSKEGMDGYGGKFLEKKVVRRKWKTPREKSTSGPGSEHDDEELGDDEGSNR